MMNMSMKCAILTLLLACSSNAVRLAVILENAGQNQGVNATIIIRGVYCSLSDEYLCQILSTSGSVCINEFWY